MTKEEKIKEAWGENWSKISKENQKKALNNNGFVSQYFEDLLTIDKRERKLFEIRPKSLQGIETNNGWIKIESEDDLPKDENIVEFWVYDDEEIVSAKFMYESKRWYHDVNLNLRLFPTHYQPIEKPKPPIY